MILYLSLFVYGLTTFISPCSLGLVTAYLTYTIKDTMNRGHGLLVGLSFMSAMSLVFFTFGYALSSLIPINLATSKLFYILAGGLMILLGVNTLGLIERLGPIRAIIYNISDRMDVIRTGMVSRQQNIERVYLRYHNIDSSRSLLPGFGLARCDDDVVQRSLRIPWRLTTARVWRRSQPPCVVVERARF